MMAEDFQPPAGFVPVPGSLESQLINWRNRALAAEKKILWLHDELAYVRQRMRDAEGKNNPADLIGEPDYFI